MRHPNTQACDAIAAACAKLRVTHHALTTRLALRLLTPPDAVAKMSRLAIARQPEMIPHRHAFWRAAAELLGLPMSALGPPGWVSHIPALPFIATPEPEPAPPPPPPPKPPAPRPKRRYATSIPIPPDVLAARAHRAGILREAMASVSAHPSAVARAITALAPWVTPACADMTLRFMLRAERDGSSLWRIIPHILPLTLDAIGDKEWQDGLYPLQRPIATTGAPNLKPRRVTVMSAADPASSPHLRAMAALASCALRQVVSERGLRLRDLVTLLMAGRRADRRAATKTLAASMISADRYPVISWGWRALTAALRLPIDAICADPAWIEAQPIHDAYDPPAPADSATHNEEPATKPANRHPPSRPRR